MDNFDQDSLPSLPDSETPEDSPPLTSAVGPAEPKARASQSHEFWPLYLFFAFILGLGSGYLIWGRISITPNPPATPQTSAPTKQAAPVSQVTLPDSYTLPVSFGDIGPRLVAAGAIDYDRFVQLYAEAGQPLTEEQLKLLTRESDTPVVINRENAYFLLNFLWAAGLTNQNPVLTKGVR